MILLEDCWSSKKMSVCREFVDSQKLELAVFGGLELICPR